MALAVERPLGPFSRAPEGLAVLAQPRAALSGIVGLIESPEGPRLGVRVTAAPEAGEANVAIVALLTKTWHLPQSSLTHGAKDRRKTFLIAGDPRVLAGRARNWITQLASG